MSAREQNASRQLQWWEAEVYNPFFGLTADPFSVNPDPRFLYLNPQIQEALAALSYGIQNRKGFVLLTGEVGTGKTTLLNKVLQWLRSRGMATAFIFNPKLTVSEFFEFMMADFGIQVESRDKSHILLRLNDWLIERYRAGERAVLVIDEAQALSSELLEEIRLLTNLETASDKLLQIVLCGQPELDARLKDQSLRQLRQRITLRCHTRPLLREECERYIHQRLRIAGANGYPTFSKEALDLIYQCSGGIPRLINVICEQALINAFADQTRHISVEIIETVTRDFEFEAQQPLPANGAADQGMRIHEALHAAHARSNGNGSAAAATAAREAK
jgi:general secretion pathway protein A